MRTIADVTRRYSAKLFSKDHRSLFVLVSLCIYSGIAFSLYLICGFGAVSIPSVMIQDLFFKILMIYLSITLIFALGLSQAGFVMIPVFSVFVGFWVSIMVYTGINESFIFFFSNTLPFTALLMTACICYGASQLRCSWQLFSSGDPRINLQELQDNIKLYYFTLAVFALLTALVSGLGYIISFVYRSLF